MKKNLLFVLAFLASVAVMGQPTKGVLVSHDFSDGLQANGWTIDAQLPSWNISQTNIAGGTAPEAFLDWDPSFNGITRIISPVVDISSLNAITIEMKHALLHYSGDYSVGIATRSNEGAWNTIWSRGSGDVTEMVTVAVENEDLGSSTFQFCVYFSGNNYNINGWLVDDIALNSVLDNDMAAYSIDMPAYAGAGIRNVIATVKNMGSSAITSFDIQYQIDGGTPVVETVTGVNLNLTNTYTYTFNQTWEVVPGEYEITVAVNNINGNGDDDDMSNNSISKNITFASGSVPYLPLFEEFTSSTCGPCASFNTVFTPFLAQHEGEYAIIKYQMSWPGSGDPYYTAEGGVRRNYYGVNGVPQLFLAGKEVSTSISTIETTLADLLLEESFYKIEAEAVIDNSNNFTLNIDVTPYISANNLTLHAAVIEHETTGNVGSNGETSFHYVMMKMLPDASGTTFNAVDGVVNQFNFSKDLTNTFIEDPEDLLIVIFIQNNDTKQVLQSYMDDIEYRLLDRDLMAKSINMDQFSLHGDKGIATTLVNRGNFAVTSFDIQYMINNGTPVTQSVTGINIDTYATYDFTFTQQWAATAGSHNVKVTVSNVNGEGADENSGNDSVSKTLYIASQAVNNKPLFEQFTSSTSAPSATFNEIFNPFIDSHIDELSIIKYPLKQPGTGDPYYTGEAGKRKEYYAVVDVPELYVDGTQVPTTSEGVNSAFSAATAKGAFMGINVTASIDANKKVTANVDIAPYITAENLTIHAAIVERETTGNTGTNGETSFKYTMIKMAPNATGTALSITDGQTKQLELSTSLKNTKVEDINDIDIVVFVQYDETGEVLQSAMAKIDNQTGVETTITKGLMIYPNPSQGDININAENKGIASVEVYNTIGSLVFKKQFSSNEHQVNLSLNQSQGVYLIKVTHSDGTASIGRVIVR